MSAYPEDIMQAARECLPGPLRDGNPNTVGRIARAIMAERKRAVDAVKRSGDPQGGQE
jgi:hypothetical protein